MTYAIWDTESGNRIGAHPTEEEALEDVRDTVARFGRAMVIPWALARHEGDSVDAIAESEALIDRALASEEQGKVRS